MKYNTFKYVHDLVAKRFPERRVFIRSDYDTRYLHIGPFTQLAIWGACAAVMTWGIIATAIIMYNSVGSNSSREAADLQKTTYEIRLSALASERDARARESEFALNRFTVAMDEISKMQSELLASENRRKELERGIDVIQGTLRRTLQERDTARAKYSDATDGLSPDEKNTQSRLANVSDMEETLEIVTKALSQTAKDKSSTEEAYVKSFSQIDSLKTQLALKDAKNNQIFSQLEDAVSVSLVPLDKMFRAAGMPTKSILQQVRRGYDGKGGPLTPLVVSTYGGKPDADTLRANGILKKMDELNLYRLAAEKAPFGMPVRSSFRFTSPFGWRRDPKGAGRRMHNGTDFAASLGTPIYSTGDGVVTQAGWAGGYGRQVRIKHAFGIETTYAHMSKIRVKKGQRVSRGDRIGDMGTSGRSTGVHLHYEVRVGNSRKPVNPMTYIKAGRNVF
ncbi:MAG: DUF5930 domain-containing protein [Halocynthiibacter sp.]